MDGKGGERVEAKEGGWQGDKFDATNEIKQLLKIPINDLKPHNQKQSANNNGGGSSSSSSSSSSSGPGSQYNWMDTNRVSESQRGSPGRGGPRYEGGGRPYYEGPRGHYEPWRNAPPPHWHQGYSRHRSDSYSSPGRPPNSRYERESWQHNGPHKGGGLPPAHQHHHHNNHNNNNNNNNSSGGGHTTAPPETEPADYLPAPKVLAELQAEFVFPLKKKSLKFLKAKYFCRLCEYHCDSLVVCSKHISDTRHKKLKEAKSLEMTLKNIPAARRSQVEVVDKLIQAVAEEWQVDEAGCKERQQVVTELSKLLAPTVKECQLEMVGSSLSGFCLKTSDVNVDVVTEGNLNPSTALLALRDLVASHQPYTEVKDDLSSLYPTVSFTHRATGLRVVVGAGGSTSKLTNQLLADYASLDPRVGVLGVAFRRWAQLSQIDDQARGTLAPHVFPLMLVHFLQHHQPAVLPCLHALHPARDGESYLAPSKAREIWQCSNRESVGQLWLELFRFYTIGFRMADLVVNVRQKHAMTKVERSWNKKIAVEDPFQQKRNLTRTVSGNAVFEYILDCFKMTYKYFAIPQLSHGPLTHHVAPKEEVRSIFQAASRVKRGDILLQSIEKAGQSASKRSSECEAETGEEDTEKLEALTDSAASPTTALESEMVTLSLKGEAGGEVSHNGSVDSWEDEAGKGEVTNVQDLTSTLLCITPSHAAHIMASLHPHQLSYRFEGETFTSGQPPPLICASCQKEGHCKADCHEYDLPPLIPLPSMNDHFLNQLTSILEMLIRYFEPTREEIENRNRIVAELQAYIRLYLPNVTLQLFGSSANGFGFQNSDLDICLTFDNNPSGQTVDHIKIIELLADKLKRCRQCAHVVAITTAKVPIVKFSMRRTCLDADLSLYNTLALQNTKLLLTYASIDPRVKSLGYAMKYFAKLCDIGDASRGSLSSYAYILMVLHFLQQCHPPVIPVLQELYDHSKPAPEHIIDGWNAWFYGDLKNLKNVWKDHGKNHESVGGLWVQMLRYYTETFNWKEHVVTIRQLAPLTRLEKLWNSHCIVIEDPFNLGHNLGAGLSRKMNAFIMKAFIRGREIFGTAIKAPPHGYKNLSYYLFDSSQLTDGAPPNDRGCRLCGKIGHIQRDCPKQRLGPDRRDKRDRHKEQRREPRKITAAEVEAQDPHPAHKGKDTKPTTPHFPSTGPLTRVQIKGILMVVVPVRVMQKHTTKWETSLHYQRQAQELFSMDRLPSHNQQQQQPTLHTNFIIWDGSNPREQWTVDFVKACAKVKDSELNGSWLSTVRKSSIFFFIKERVLELMLYPALVQYLSDNPISPSPPTNPTSPTNPTPPSPPNNSSPLTTPSPPPPPSITTMVFKPNPTAKVLPIVDLSSTVTTQTTPSLSTKTEIPSTVKLQTTAKPSTTIKTQTTANLSTTTDKPTKAKTKATLSLSATTTPPTPSNLSTTTSISTTANQSTTTSAQTTPNLSTTSEVPSASYSHNTSKPPAANTLLENMKASRIKKKKKKKKKVGGNAQIQQTKATPPHPADAAQRIATQEPKVYKSEPNWKARNQFSSVGYGGGRWSDVK